MKSLKLISLSLLALFALGAFAGNASAEEGFLPRPSTGIALGGESTLAPASLSKITCTKLDESIISFTNDKTGEGTLHWLGCTGPFELPAQSLGAKSGEILARVRFLVCLDPKNGTTLFDNLGMAGELVNALHLEIPAIGTLILVKGTMLGAILTAGPVKLWSMEFLGSVSLQDVTSCLQGTFTIMHTLRSETNENGKTEATSENIVGGLLQFAEEVKLEDA